ncbi:tRNA-Thr(GGU) m(6)t(6)A37 methyltransferase TsaA [Lachnospiraceae bacterium C7]|nr:tRNA-Thr(GGU) m(6)t(6)A37 methyltransferase TsaA [Lachnospiraceae bacterium C7]
MNIEPIARIYTDFPDKFGIPRQSGLVDGLIGKIVFEKKYKSVDAIRQLENFSHLWLIWEFTKSKVKPDKFVATVHPPKLGGDVKVGVFASRSPFRPNSLGLSCVKIEKIDIESEKAPIIYVSGVDILSETPIYDIKPYIPYADCHVDAKEGYTAITKHAEIEVDFPSDLLEKIKKDKQEAVLGVLKQDPRAAYNKKPDYIYGMAFEEYDIRFKAENGKLIVVDVCYRNEKNYKNVK